MIYTCKCKKSFFRIVAAVLIGCVVGLYRNLHGKPTGVKTLGLVALGSCLVTMAASAFVLSASADNTNAGHVIQGVITGIGFLGAGVIVQHGPERKISGLTTAASIWVTAALGMVCGIGAWEIVAISAVLLLLLLSVCGRIEKALHRRWLSKSPEEQAAIARREE